MSKPQPLTEASKGCLMLYLRPVDGVKFSAWSREHIPEDVLAADGYDACPHVTILYGFDTSITPQQVSAALAKFKLNELYVCTGPVSMFKNDTDVIKVSAGGPELERLHWFLRDHFKEKVSCTYPDYKGHLTLAYVKPDSCEHLVHNATFNGNIYTFTEAVYSLPDSTQQWRLKLDGSSCSICESVDEAVAKGGYTPKSAAEYSGRVSVDLLFKLIAGHAPRPIGIEELKQATTQEDLDELACKLAKHALDYLLKQEQAQALDADTEDAVFTDVIDFVIDHFEPDDLEPYGLI